MKGRQSSLLNVHRLEVEGSNSRGLELQVDHDPRLDHDPALSPPAPYTWLGEALFRYCQRIAAHARPDRPPLDG